MVDGLVVLVVDDDPVSVTLVTHVLTRAGARVQSLTSGAELLETLAGPAGADVDVVLLDLRLPDGDGRDVVRRLREGAGATSRVPVVVLTSDRDPSLDGSCREAGCDVVLRKPADSASLLATLAAVSAPVGPAGSEDGLVDGLALLDRLGDPGLARVTVEVFLDGAPGRASALAAHVATDEPDRAELHRAAHSLKSAADLVGAGPLAACCRELEAAAPTEPVDLLRVRVQDVTELLASSCEALGALELGER